MHRWPGFPPLEMRRLLCAMLAALGLQGCVTGAELIRALAQPEPSLSALTVCHGYSCSYRTPTHISEAEWREVTAIFTPAPASAEDERAMVARAIGLIETIVGRRVGTSADR